jgi:hypothetical protein
MWLSLMWILLNLVAVDQHKASAPAGLAEKVGG